MRIMWFNKADDGDLYQACFEHKGKPYSGSYEMDMELEDHETFEDIADALAHCWDMAWGRVKDAGEE